MRKFFSRLRLVLLVLSGLAYLFSPYKKHEDKDYPLIKNTIVINAPATQVYAYLGNSNNAQYWSSYVDHITPLNAAAVPDGQVGALRRCFKNANEKGEQWDEEILENTFNTARQLSIFNTKNFTISAEGLNTRQEYKPLSDTTCELSFTLFYNKPKISILDLIKIKYSAYVVSNIFDKNLNNIKRLNEQ
jgi:uncharacterized membrane protein